MWTRQYSRTPTTYNSLRAFQSRDWGRRSVQSEGGDNQRMAGTEAFRHNLSAQVGRGNSTASERERTI